MKKPRGMIFSISVFLIALFCGKPQVLGVVPPSEDVPIFYKSELYVQQGDDLKELKAILTFFPDKLGIRGGIQMEIPYSDINKIIYERSTHPRVKTAIFLSPWALLSKSKKHWLYIFLEDTSYMLRLDKKEYQMILMSFKAKSGLDIEYRKN